MLHFNSTRMVRLNPTDPFDLSRAERKAREQMLELFLFLKENIEGFENADLAFSSRGIGVPRKPHDRRAAHPQRRGDEGVR